MPCTIKQFQSAEVCCKFRILAVFREPNLVFALPQTERFEKWPWLPYGFNFKSWRKQEFNYKRRVCHQVGSQYPHFFSVICENKST